MVTCQLDSTTEAMGDGESELDLRLSMREREREEMRESVRISHVVVGPLSRMCYIG